MIQVGETDEMLPIPDNLPKCGNWPPTNSEGKFKRISKNDAGVERERKMKQQRENRSKKLANLVKKKLKKKSQNGTH